MLAEDEIRFLQSAVTKIHNETKQDKLVILSILCSHYFNDIVLTIKTMSAITGIKVSVIRHIENIAMNKLSHPKIKEQLNLF